MSRALPLLLAALLVVPALVTVGASAGPLATAQAAKPVRIAIIDTGIDAAHTEFASGQVVAWWDFTDERKSASLTDPYSGVSTPRSFDPYVAPFDLDGHGTAVASAAAGLNLQDCGSHRFAEKLSFSPGAELVVAKVARINADDGGTDISGDIGLAMRWAADMGADVISMSIGAIVPVPLRVDNSGIAYAASKALVVVAAGNGVAGAGLVPFHTWASFYGNSPHVLTVGGGDRDGKTVHTTTGNLDPDVTSFSESVCVARVGGGYRQMSGTSFAAPLVAGIAGKAISAARINGASDAPGHIERLLLLSGSNNQFAPYAREGMGFILDAEVPAIVAGAASGVLPDPAARGAHFVADLFYHDVVLERAKNSQFL